MRAFHTFDVTLPSTVREFSFWNARTAFSVSGPNSPSTVTLRMRWSSLTAAPLEPRRTELGIASGSGFGSGFGFAFSPVFSYFSPSRAFHTLAVTCPSTLRDFSSWNFRTALSVAGPKLPSTGSLSSRCSSLTDSPVEPRRTESCFFGLSESPRSAMSPSSTIVFQVALSRTPVALTPFFSCHSRRAAFVPGPKTPSAVTPRTSCASTTSGPEAPSLRVG